MVTIWIIYNRSNKIIVRVFILFFTLILISLPDALEQQIKTYE